MKKIFLSFVMLLSAVCSFAQDSFETALTLHEGENSSQVYEIDYYKGAYFKYHADQTCIVTLTGKSLNYNFYNEDQTGNYDYYYESVGSLYSYSVKVEAGKDMYVFVYSYSADAVNFTATIADNIFAEGATSDNPQPVESGKKYWFDSYVANMTYTAAEDGVLVLNLTFYPEMVQYYVDGNGTTASKDDEDNVNIPVSAGKTYNICITAYSSLFPVGVRFVQPQQGDTKDNPFTLVLGDNTLPAAAQKYYYAYTNGDKTGFLTITANGTIYARNIYSSYDDINYGEDNMVKLKLQPDQEILITVEKKQATEEAEVLTANFAEPQAGDLEETAIALTSSETEATAAPVGVTYYTITNSASDRQFLNIAVDTEGISTYSNSSVKIYSANSSWNTTDVSSGTTERLQAPAGEKYYVVVTNKETEPINFRVWFETMSEGDVYNNPITLQAGENNIAAGQRFYSYTPATTCKLTVNTDLDKATVFFPTYEGDEYSGRDLISSGNGEYVLAAEAGQTYIMRVTASKATTLNITEVAYGQGASRETAVPFDGTYTFDDLNPYNVWLVYEAPRAGIAEISCNGIETITWDDDIDVFVGDDVYGTKMRGYDSSYNYIMKNVCLAVAEGEKVYVHIAVKSYAEGAQLVVSVRDANPGEDYTNPIMLTSGENKPNTMAYVGYTDAPVWYAFETQKDGDVTFNATEYLSANLYSSDMVLIKAGEYSDDMYIGGYYEPATLTLTAGKYYFRLNTNYYSTNELTLTGSAFDNITAITEVAASKKATDGIYNIAGQRVSAGAKGLLIINGRKVMKK